MRRFILIIVFWVRMGLFVIIWFRLINILCVKVLFWVVVCKIVLFVRIMVVYKVVLGFCLNIERKLFIMFFNLVVVCCFVILFFCMFWGVRIDWYFLDMWWLEMISLVGGKVENCVRGMLFFKYIIWSVFRVLSCGSDVLLDVVLLIKVWVRVWN